MAMPALRYAAQKNTKENTRYEQRQLDFSALDKQETETRTLKNHLQLAVHNRDLTQVDLPISQRKTSALSGQHRQGLIHQYQSTQQNKPSAQRKKQIRQRSKRMPSPRAYISAHSWVSDLGVLALMLMPYVLIAR